jgi:hypothetical protein
MAPSFSQTRLELLFDLLTVDGRLVQDLPRGFPLGSCHEIDFSISLRKTNDRKIKNKRQAVLSRQILKRFSVFSLI